MKRRQLDRNHLIEIASGRKKATLVLKNARVVNVFTEKTESADIAIEGEYIAGIGRYQGITEIDLDGKFVCPGLIDGHIHLESSMLTPYHFQNIVMPHGTTTVITDPHEIANVAGRQGIEFMLDATDGLLLDVFLMLPSCVPASALDESGAILESHDLVSFYQHPRVLGLAEVMDAAGIVKGSEALLAKIDDAQHNHRPVDGHAPLLTGYDLNAYIAAGVQSDHECSNLNEALEKLSRGQWVMIREGTAAKNLDALMGLFEAPFYHRTMLVTDDKHPEDLIEDGHLDGIIRKAVRRGADPIRAIKMTSYQPAVYFGLNDRGAIAPGYIADLVVVDDLQTFQILDVYKEGRRIADHPEYPPYQQQPDEIYQSFCCKEFSANDFHLEETGENQRIIELVSGELLTRAVEVQCIKVDGYPAGVNPKQDVIKLAVAERHHHTGHIGIGFLKGYGLKKGAVASSVAHDSHNLIITGTNDHDMALAANAVRKNQGGLAVAVDGEVIGELALPIGGLMSDQPAQEVARLISQLKRQLCKLGIGDSIDPFMTLAFISLPVIPEVRLNSKGMIDVGSQRFIKVFN